MAHGEIAAQDRYLAALGTRLAVNGTPQQFETLKPRQTARGWADDDYDETGLAEDLAGLGFYLVEPGQDANQ